MCLIVFAYKVHPAYPLILAANRDEFFHRPAKPAHVWRDKKPLITAGKDLKAGGTWLGVSETGRLAALTNYRDIKNIKENAPSRGNIVINALRSPDDPEKYLTGLRKTAHQYNGFNLLTGTTEGLFYYTNQKKQYTKIEPGFHSISNAFLNSPWPKTNKALEKFKPLVRQNKPDENSLLELLADTERFPSQMLPETGLSTDLEKAVSSIFILTDGYGTRCSTLIFIDSNGEARFIERSFVEGSQNIKHHLNHSFRIRS